MADIVRISENATATTDTSPRGQSFSSSGHCVEPPSLHGVTVVLFYSCTISAMRRARLIVVVLGFASLFATASGQPVSQLRPSNYVNDFAHVLSPETEASLNDLCNQVEEKARAQIAVVTINSLDGRDIEGYAVDLFKQWGVGHKKSDHGVLIL